MKINYIKEGYFKNPEQARSARANREDNKTEIAKLATKLLEQPLSKILTKAIELDESSEKWYEGTVLNSQVFDGLSLAFNFSELTLNRRVVPEAVVKISNDKTLYIDTTTNAIYRWNGSSYIQLNASSSITSLKSLPARFESLSQVFPFSSDGPGIS